ncbi:hypothetical protein GGR51DRAFT_164931 [Nemania sp. FL0031]|nr:hypothetical protein GGR51DRAFT_164931 [Nemania sp. FL0031]
MGIKGIYKEIGSGKRISLTKLAVQKLEESDRPLRIAIDISIWQFQVQAARGGSNPAVRTLFYRLLRLLSLSIQPIFVFDGPNKPAFKRNKRSGRGDGVATAMAKRLIRLFGFIVHDAPGEAEAECALLQQNGIVDAVLSEDVDTIMFGCTRTLRNWSAEGTKGSKTPTHVSMYDTLELSQGSSGLDREGMVLVALMSGGDYIPEGIPGAGIKVACEAARAGFGKSLCQLKRSDTSELASWKERLVYELRQNESGFFRTRHKALNIPDDFPSMEVLRYYTHPVVSPAKTLDRLKKQTWDGQIDIQGLREFVRETFDWSYRIGAIKFIRVLAPCLLVRKLMQRGDEQDSARIGINETEKEASELVKSIKSRRAHFSTDATPEFRVSFIPTNIVGYDFQEEPDEVIEFGRDGLALNSDDEMEEPAEGDVDSTAKPGARKPFSPTDIDLLWVPEVIAKVGIPSMVEEWEEGQRAKTVARSKPKASKQKAKAGGTATASMNKFVKVTKNNMLQAAKVNKPTRQSPRLRSSPAHAQAPLDALPAPSPIDSPLPLSTQCSQPSRTTRSSKPVTPRSSRSRRKPPAALQVDININPWTIASSQGSPKAIKPTSSSSSTKISEPILIPSSPISPPTRDIPSPISYTKETYNHHEPDPFTTQPTSPRKRRSLTPPRPTIDEASIPSDGPFGDQSPILAPTEKPQRKLARTESLPANSSPLRPRAQTSKFPRAQTVAIETISLDSDSNFDSDSDFELPPLSTLLNNKTPQSKKLHEGPLSLPSPTSPRTAPRIAANPFFQKDKLDQRPKGAAEGKQRTLQQSFAGGGGGMPAPRMTKLYMPRKSQPGFFREVDVSVDEADALREEYANATITTTAGKAGRRAPVWRRSDVSCVDLTGED